MERESSWLTCTRTQSALSRLEESLASELADDDPYVRDISTYLTARGGKRLRPALFFLASTFGDGRADEELLMRAATALELLHVASLYHDDVMDRAPTRRHLPSANAQWGNVVASLGGTFLFTRAAALFTQLGPGPNTMCSDAILRISIGQMMEIEQAYNVNLTEQEHLDILARKTATLFELPLRLGAHLTGAPDGRVETLTAYGRQLGLAFQITDDALDLVGDESQLGKATASDLRAGVFSLSVLRALRRADCGTSIRDLLQRLELSAGEISDAAQMIVESGVVDESLLTARRTAQEALALLDELPDGDSRRSLGNLAHHVVERTS